MYEKTFDEVSEVITIRNFKANSPINGQNTFEDISIINKKRFLSARKFRYYKSKQLSFPKKNECFVEGHEQLIKSTEKGRIIIGFNIYKFKRLSKRIKFSFKIWAENSKVDIAKYITSNISILDSL